MAGGSGLLQLVTTKVEQVITGFHVVLQLLIVEQVSVTVQTGTSVEMSQVDVHVVIGEHVVTASQTVITEFTHGGWGGHMGQSVVVVTVVVVVKLVEHETVEVMVMVTVPTT